MKFSSWLDALKAGRPRRPIRRAEPHGRRRKSGGKLSVENLEDRTVPAFVGPVDYSVDTNPQAVATGHFNSDTILDLVVVNSGSNNVSVLLGNADGTFQPAINSDTDTAAGAGVGPRSLIVGDFDGDNKTDDVATVNNTDISILLGNGDGTLLLKHTLSLPSVTDPEYDGDLTQAPLSVAVGDVSGDGKLDLVVTGFTSFTSIHGPYTGYDYWGNPYEYFNYVGHNNGHVNVLLGNGLGDFAAAGAPQLLEGSYPISAVLEELDSTPGLDLAAADSYGGRVRVLSGNNDGTFDAPVDFATGWNPTSVLTGDVNGDDISDLITANYYSASVLLGNGSGGVGDGTFQSARHVTLDYYADSVAVGDVNDDGKLDLVTSSNFYTQTGDYWNGYSGFYTGQISVLLGYGDGTFAGPTGHRTLDDGDYASGMAVGDFNGDDLPDVAVTNSDADSSDASVFRNAGGWVLPAKLTINDVTVTEGNSGTVELTFTVTRGGNLEGPVTVNYNTANGGALAGSDYVAKSGTLTFGDGVATQTITILVNGDLTDEFDQGFSVNLSNPSGEAVLADGQGVGTIQDNDPPPTITITPRVSVKEGNNNNNKGNNGTTTLNFIVTLSAVSEKQVWVNFATANGTATTADGDYIANAGTVFFSPGDTSETISVVIRGDKKKESTETFTVNLSGATSATILGAQGIGEILDDDTPSKGPK